MSRYLGVIFMIVLLFGCQQKITQEQALKSAQDFVNENVKFYSRDDIDYKNVSYLQKVSIKVVEIYEEGDDYMVQLYIESNKTGELKKSGLVVAVDSRTGEVDKENTAPFKV